MHQNPQTTQEDDVKPITLFLIRHKVSHLLAHADLVVSMHPNHGILGAEHHGRGAHGDLGQGLPGSRVLGEVHHARLLALRTVSALLLPSCTKVGHSSAAVALA